MEWAVVALLGYRTVLCTVVLEVQNYQVSILYHTNYIIIANHITSNQSDTMYLVT